MTSEERKKAQADLASFVAAEVEAVLAQHDGLMRRQTRISAGRLSGHVAAAMTVLSRRQHHAIDAMQGDLAALAKEFIASLAVTATRRFRDTSGQPSSEGLADEQTNSSSGFHAREQKGDLSSMKVEDWAGPVAGPTFLEVNFNIPRSTLYRWQRRSEVIALLKGGRKYVFPLAQFVDGRPAAGIQAVLSIIGHPRFTWFWLTHPCPSLDDRKPIDLLRIDMIHEVVEAAQACAIADERAGTKDTPRES